MLVGPGQVASTATAQLCASIENTGVNVVGGGGGLLPEGAVTLDVGGDTLANTQNSEGVGAAAGCLQGVTDGQPLVGQVGVDEALEADGGAVWTGRGFPLGGGEQDAQGRGRLLDSGC